MQYQIANAIADTAPQARNGCRVLWTLPRVEGASSPWMFPYGAVIE